MKQVDLMEFLNKIHSDGIKDLYKRREQGDDAYIEELDVITE